MTMTKKILLLCVLVFPGFLMIGDVRAQGPGPGREINGGRLGPYERARPRPARIKDKACVMECRGDLRTCLEAVREDAAPCFAACDALKTAAREACDANPMSDSCGEARRVLHECMHPCDQPLRAQIRVCISAGQGCVQTCPDAENLPCLRRCGADHNARRSAARADAYLCREGCSAEREAAREACAGGPDEECETARAALRACVEPCKDGFRDALNECRTRLRACVDECADEEEPGPGAGG